MIEFADALPFSEWDEKTKKWRVAVRGEDRRVGERVREKAAKRFNSQESWTRRFLAQRPGAQFDERGRLIIGEDELLEMMKKFEDRFNQWAGNK